MGDRHTQVSDTRASLLRADGNQASRLRGTTELNVPPWVLLS